MQCLGSHLWPPAWPERERALGAEPAPFRPVRCPNVPFCGLFPRQVADTDRALGAEREASQAARAEAVSLRSELSAVQSELSQLSNTLMQERGESE